MLANADLAGITDHGIKEVLIDPCEETEKIRFQVFWHEFFHVFLFETGLHNLLSDKEEETFCDAFGAYLTKLMEQGFLQVK